MKRTSQLFGAFTYTQSEVLTFPYGLLGFEDYTRYVLRKTNGTHPIRWLISVEEGGPELALIDPTMLVQTFRMDRVPLDKGMLMTMEAENLDDLKLYAVVTLPDNIHHMSMNLRTPILINPKARLGMQYPAPGIHKQPIRRFIYRDLVHSKETDKLSTVVTLRKVNETIEIGDEISVQVLEFADGGVRLGICAPKRVHISRGTHAVTPVEENLRANEGMDLATLKGIMSVYNVGARPVASVASHQIGENEQVQVAG